MATAKRRWIRHGRSHAPSVVAKTTSRDDGILEVRAPFPGFFRGGPGPGSLVAPAPASWARMRCETWCWRDSYPRC